MFGAFRVDQVLRPIRNLQLLIAFAFPRNTDFRSVRHIEEIAWPPNLEQVSLSGIFFPSRPLFSAEPSVRNWPSSLRQVVLDSVYGLTRLYDESRVFPNMSYNLDSVHVADRNMLFSPQNMAVDFSGVRLLSLPANFAVTNHKWYRIRPVLERLEIRRKNEVGPHQFIISDLLDHAEGIPTLQQIRLHSSLVEGHGDGSALEVADALLRSRAQDQKLENEAMTTITPEDAGIIIFDD